MSISKEELKKVCGLASLEYEDCLHPALLKDINAIMDFVEQLRACDVASVAPLFHPFELHQQFREDIPNENSCIQELESIAPLFEDGFYLVPKVIEE